MKRSATSLLLGLVLGLPCVRVEAALDQPTAKVRDHLVKTHAGSAAEEELYRAINGCFLKEDYAGVRRLARRYRAAGYSDRLGSVEELDDLSARQT